MCFDDALDVCKGPGVETKFNWRSHYVRSTEYYFVCAGEIAELGGGLRCMHHHTEYYYYVVLLCTKQSLLCRAV